MYHLKCLPTGSDMRREESYQALLNTKGPHRAYVASAQSLVLACYVTRFDKVW